MPIAANPDGVLDIENATLRSREIATLSNFVAGNDEIRSSGAPVVEVYGDPANVGGLLPTLELVSNTESVTGTSFTRFTSNAGVFTIQSGTDGDADSKGDIAFSSVDGDTEHMRIQGSTGRVGIGRNNPACALDIAGEDVMIRGNTPSLNFSEGTDAMDAGFRIHHDGANQADNNNFLAIQTGSSFGVTSLHCQYGGNVGIGDSSPSSKLDVNGSVRGAYNSDTTSYFGRSAIGYTGHPDHASFSHIDQNSTGGYALLHSSSGTTYLNCAPGQAIRLRIDNSDRITMDANGRLGIGTTTVRVPLHVNGGVNPVISSGQRWYSAYFNRGGGNTWIYDSSPWGESTSIYGSHAIVCRSYFASLAGYIGASDERIKKEIVDVEDGSALETLRLLKPKQYKYVDEVQRGSEPVWGFIAQEVRDTLPYATELRTECLPNIYELANVSASNVITFTNFDTSNLESNAMVLKVFDVDDTEHLINITEVIDGHSIRVDEDLSKLTGSVDETGNVITQTETTTLTLEEYEALALDDKTDYVLGESNTYTKTTTTNIGNNLFVYGQEVSDFLFLKKDAIFTVATSALQEVDRQLQAERVKVATLETQVASVLTRLDALESA
jgi:hypothetical protein